MRNHERQAMAQAAGFAHEDSRELPIDPLRSRAARAATLHPGRESVRQRQQAEHSGEPDGKPSG